MTINAERLEGHSRHGVVGDSRVVDAARRGLLAVPRTLPPWLFYDAEGSRLYERITELPEYYLARAEREIFVASGREIIERVMQGSQHPLGVVELGAGSAWKSQLLLEVLIERQASAVYVPVDVSEEAVAMTQTRLRALPRVVVRPVLGPYDAALDALQVLGARRLVLFLGNSVGNLSDEEATGLLGRMRRAVGSGDAMLLGTDLRKDPSELLPAYDDAQGVTAAFNRNVLARLNRELGADFDLDRWCHVALWNGSASRIEMHLESAVPQRVHLGVLDAVVSFAAGERIHTESSVKYDDAHVARISAPAGWFPERRWTDAAGRFAAHLLRAA